MSGINYEAARKLAFILWAMTKANADDGLQKAWACIAEAYGAETADAFCDAVSEALAEVEVNRSIPQ
jgi:hypothetical protein